MILCVCVRSNSGNRRPAWWEGRGAVYTRCRAYAVGGGRETPFARSEPDVIQDECTSWEHVESTLIQAEDGFKNTFIHTHTPLSVALNQWAPPVSVATHATFTHTKLRGIWYVCYSYTYKYVTFIRSRLT